MIEEQQSNFHKAVSESKEVLDKHTMQKQMHFFQVTKAYSMLSSCLSGLKLELGHFQNIWKKYSEIWNVEREVTLSLVFTLLVIRSTLPRWARPSPD